MRPCARVLTVAFSLCAGPALAEGPKVDPARAFIEKQATAFSEAFARADFKSLAAMYTEDAIAFPPDADMVKGRPAIEALWKSIYDSGVKGATLKVVDVVSGGELAAEVGTAVLTTRQEATQTVKYVVVWKRQTDGTWKLYRDIWNAMPQTPQR